MARFGKIDKDDLVRFGKIWQDMTRGTWQDLVRIDKGDMSRFGKIWKDLTRGAMAEFGKI